MKWGAWLWGLLLVAACGGGGEALPDAGSGTRRSDGRDASTEPVRDSGPAAERCRDEIECAGNPAGLVWCDRQHNTCVECLADADCRTGERCIQHQCGEERSCLNSLDCELGAVCDNGERICVECSSSGDCELDSICASSHCQPRCDSDKDCTPLGMLCDRTDGHCAISGAVDDAPDASVVTPMSDAMVPPAACTDPHVDVARVLATIMFVVDGSSSMEMGYGPVPDGGMPAGPGMAAPGQATRWSAVRSALVDPSAGIVNRLGGQARFGLAVFGTMPTCPLPTPIVEPALGNAAMIAGALPLTPPGIFTPTGPALDQVVALLPDPTISATGPQIIILATDGEPNGCGDAPNLPMTDYAPSIAAATNARAKHLKMYVISVADAAGEFAAHLQQMANLGAGLDAAATPGAAVYYPDALTELSDTVAALINEELPCDLELSRGVMAGRECTGSVMLNGNQLECNGADGWKLIDPTHIRLDGAACQALRSADALVQANFPCTAQL